MNVLESLLHVIGSAINAKPPTGPTGAPNAAGAPRAAGTGPVTGSQPVQGAQPAAGSNMLVNPGPPQGQAPPAIEPRLLALMQLLHPEQLQQLKPQVQARAQYNPQNTQFNHGAAGPTVGPMGSNDLMNNPQGSFNVMGSPQVQGAQAGAPHPQPRGMR